MGDHLVKITSIIAGAVGGPVGLLAEVGGLFYDGYQGVYADLQNGKNHMRAVGANWPDHKKHIANQKYKEVCPPLHRPGSPDVFPGK
jgi:hypothetical protein